MTPRSGALRLPAGGALSTAIQVVANEPGQAVVPVAVSAVSNGRTVELTHAELLVTVPHANIADAYTSVGVTTDADVDPPSLGDGFDGAGSSYSAEALATAGLTPGTAFTADGVTVRWPDVPTAQPDNVLANGQSFALSTSGSTLGILVAASYGPAAGTWTVHYSDGTSDALSMATPDWTSAPPADATVLVTMPYRKQGRHRPHRPAHPAALPEHPARPSQDRGRGDPTCGEWIGGPGTTCTARVRCGSEVNPSFSTGDGPGVRAVTEGVGRPADPDVNPCE